MGKKASFNDRHPELREGEMLVGNVHIVDEESMRSYVYSQCATKRLGEIAYDVAGHRVSGARPWFVQREEHERVKRENRELMASAGKARMGG